MRSTFCGSPPLSFRPLLRMAEGLCCSFIVGCSFVYPFVSKEASLKHLSFYHPDADICIRKHKIVCVHLIVYLFLYLYACNSTIRSNTLIIRLLQRHGSTLYDPSLRHGALCCCSSDLGYLLDASLSRPVFHVESAADRRAGAAMKVGRHFSRASLG